MEQFCAGIHVLVKKKNKYLLLRRGVDDFEDPNCWDLPGGGINFKETPFEAAIRETKEEAGIKIKIVRIIALYSLPYQGKWSIEAIVEGKYLSGKIKLSKEHSDFKWVSKGELKKIRPRSDNLKSLFKHSL